MEVLKGDGGREGQKRSKDGKGMGNGKQMEVNEW